MKKILIIIFFCLAEDTFACTSFVESPEQICMRESEVFSSQFKNCLYKLLELSEEEYRNNFDPCSESSSVGPSYVSEEIDKSSAEFLYIEMLKKNHRRSMIDKTARQIIINEGDNN